MRTSWLWGLKLLIHFPGVCYNAVSMSMYQNIRKEEILCLTSRK